jgi:hypothetical protein
VNDEKNVEDEEMKDVIFNNIHQIEQNIKSSKNIDNQNIPQNEKEMNNEMREDSNNETEDNDDDENCRFVDNNIETNKYSKPHHFDSFDRFDCFVRSLFLSFFLSIN